MSRKVELPIIAPIFSTYNHQCAATAIIINNPSIKNWVLNKNVSLFCNRRFLKGYTTPEISVIASQYESNPYLEKIYIDLNTNKSQFSALVRHFVDRGYYVYFNNIDDYYLNGKTWYKERHFFHDGIICGYDRDEKKYCVYAYDSTWTLRKIWIPYSSFNKGIKSMKASNENGYIVGLKPTDEKVEFMPQIAINKVREYLDSNFKKYPKDQDGTVYGIVVHDYMQIYLDKLIDGSIPYEKMDYRIFRVIWEHKKVMLERIKELEQIFGLSKKWSNAYEKIVDEANTMRMLYASYSMRKRDTVLSVIKEKLKWINKQERKILTNLIEVVEEGNE